MPSKADLEKSVADLEVKLAAAEAKVAELSKPSTPGVSVPVVATVTVGDVTDDQVARLKEEFESKLRSLELKLLDVEHDRDEWKLQHENLLSVKEADNRNMADQNASLKKQLAEQQVKYVPVKNVIPPGHLVFEGTLLRVVKQERVADLCEQWKKRFVDDNDVALLVVKV